MAFRFLVSTLKQSTVIALKESTTGSRSSHSAAFTNVSVKNPRIGGSQLPSSSFLRTLFGGTENFHTESSGAFLSGGRREYSSMAAHGAQSVDLSPATRIIPGLVHSAWHQDEVKPTHPKLTTDTEADVVVVGAGISGLSIAYNLVNAGKKVVVLESKAIGGGMTGRTTAHIMKWNDDYYSTLEGKFGVGGASLVADSHAKSIDWVRNVVEKEKIDCDFQLVPGYLFGHDDDIRHKGGPSSSTKETLSKEFSAAHRLGLTDTQQVHLGYDPKRGTIGQALLFPNNGDFHPLKYINGLARCIIDKGGRIFEQTRVMSYDAHEVSSMEGVKVSARNAVVLATNSPIDHNLAVHARQVADRSYVVGLKIPKGSVEKAQWWDTADPYHYVRTSPEKDYEVLIVGGEDHTTGIDKGSYYDAYGKLEAWARERWPVAQEVLYRWTGQVYEPADNLGLYGVEPFSETVHGGDLYIATGDSGQGMTGGTIAGLVISDLILGRKNPWAEVYNPKRMLKGFSSLGPFAEEFAKNLKGYGKLILPSSMTPVDELPKDDGKIMQKGIHHVAVYKDSEGKVHEYSAICPHMKALIEWNPIDKTFDCPCHGSIFDRFGRCINGPAKADLSPVPA